MTLLIICNKVNVPSEIHENVTIFRKFTNFLNMHNYSGDGAYFYPWLESADLKLILQTSEKREKHKFMCLKSQKDAIITANNV